MGQQLTIADDNNTTVDLQTSAGVRPSVSIDDQTHSSPDIGRVLRNRYVLVARLGSGGKGTVYKALDRYRAELGEAQKYVAIKILHATAANRGELLADLSREFYRTQALSHRNIVNVFELDRDGDVDFFTMELLEGELLSDIMARLQPTPMPRPQAWSIIREIGSALEYAHAHNVVHADLKPQNIMVTDSGEVRLLDFGASSTSAGSAASTEQPLEDRPRPRNPVSSVTPAYACCELLEGRSPDPRDDIYAMACLSYELLAGEHPFQRRRSTEARDFGIVPKRPPGLRRRQWQALTMGLASCRARRSSSMRAWLDKLNGGEEAEPLPAAHELESAPAKSRPPRSYATAALCGALLICVTVWASVAGLVGRQIGANNVVSSAAASAQPNSRSAPAAESAALPATSAATDAVAQNAAALDTPSQAAQMPSQIVDGTKGDAGRPKSSAAQIAAPMVSAGDYTVRSGERFAEIRVHRSTRWGADSPFVWWTEAASAKPGVDYVHQGRAIQAFPKGKSSTSFFVKLLPAASRTQPEVFYIAIAATGRGASPGQIARAAVWLPSNHDQS